MCWNVGGTVGSCVTGGWFTLWQSLCGGLWEQSIWGGEFGTRHAQACASQGIEGPASPTLQSHWSNPHHSLCGEASSAFQAAIPAPAPASSPIPFSDPRPPYPTPPSSARPA